MCVCVYCGETLWFGLCVLLQTDTRHTNTLQISPFYSCRWCCILWVL